MQVKYNSTNKDIEVFSKVEDIALYTPNNDTLSEICFVKISNPRLSGSAYYFHTAFNVGEDAALGFTTGDYVYIDNTKYLEIELTLPADLIKLYNHPISSLNATLVKYIKNWFKKRDRLAGCSLLFEVPTKCYIKEKDVTFVKEDGIIYDQLNESPADQTAEVTNTNNSLYNDGLGPGSDNSELSNNTTLLVAAAAVALALLTGDKEKKQ